jgi:peptidoglycan/LPS O-acetylase OafA/YrhL
MNKRSRLTGVDLFRGIAVYAVAILHAGNSTPASTGWAGFITQFSGFAVPFFLATSFYLAISKLYTSGTLYSLRLRLPRLLVPYILWSAIYLLYKILKYWSSHQFQLLANTFQDPIAIVFFGGAFYHLYFIPLLVVGTLLVKTAEYLIKNQVRTEVLLLLLFVSLAIYQVVIVSGNSFELGANVAFQGLLSSILPNGNDNLLLRVILVELSWVIRCMPYIFTALLLVRLSVQKYTLKLNVWYIYILFILFFTLNAFGSLFLPVAVHEIARGFSALLLALALSHKLPENPLIQNLGLCAFGIYLMHLIWLEVFKTLVNRAYPQFLTEVSALTLLAFATLSFFVSWSIASFLTRKKGLLPKLLFGT